MMIAIEHNKLSRHDDLFAWSTVDIPEIDPSFHCHRLAICKDAKQIA